jgi:hypothetical protein
MSVTAPFSISVQDSSSSNSGSDLRELHFSFSSEFQQMSVEQRLETIRAYIESLLRQSQTLHNANEQKGLMTVIEISEQLLPHIQSDSLPLEQTLVVEMGEGGEGESLDELLS